MGVGPVPILVRSTVSAGPWLSPASGSAGSRAHHTPLVRDVCHTEHFVLPRISESKIQNYTIIHRDFFRSCARVELGQASSLRAVQQQGPRPSQPAHLLPALPTGVPGSQRIRTAPPPDQYADRLVVSGRACPGPSRRPPGTGPPLPRPSAAPGPPTGSPNVLARGSCSRFVTPASPGA